MLESWLLRRLITIPWWVFCWAVVTLVLPLSLCVLGLGDLWGRTGGAAIRLNLMICGYLWLDIFGMIGATLGWLLGLLGRWGMRASRRWHVGLQRWWGRSLLALMKRLFGLEVQVDGSELVASGPLLILMRHASVIDTLIPISEVPLVLRYVLKRELLVEPCLDLVGHRLPNVFVRRHGGDPAQTARVAALGEDLGVAEGVLIYPEGTRFTSAKRARLVEKFEATGDDEALAYAKELRAVLPPRFGGTLALLAADPQVDVVVCVHAGLEQLVDVRTILKNGGRARRVKVAFWRYAAAEIPQDAVAQRAWLMARWREVDRWVQEAQRSCS